MKAILRPKTNIGTVTPLKCFCEVLQKGNFENPETLKDLEPVQRLNVLCKLIPYVLPKIKAVHSEKGEPKTENKTTFSGYQW